MVYNPATDFLALWRNIAGTVSKTEMPGLDYVVAALARAGFINLSVSATAPVVSQATTAWLQAAVPSYSAEGIMHLWDPVAASYAPATPALFFKMLETSSGQNGVSWWTTAGGPPINTVGNDGDFAIQTDEPGGIYGPKAAGAWPADPLPGTTDIIGSAQLDLTFGDEEGNLLYRGPVVWQSLPIGAANQLMFSSGAVPGWGDLSALLDAVFGNAQGSILYRDVALWNDLPPGAANQILSTGGPGANPAWAPRTAEFPSGTVMLFQQTAAPSGWTKQTALNDVGLRVTSGAVGSVAGSAFSTVFAQTLVGDTTLSVSQMPNHSHATNANAQNPTSANGSGNSMVAPSVGSVFANGGSTSHAHSINLTLAYVDVIIASKN
jgi:hypothetical protein